MLIVNDQVVYEAEADSVQIGISRPTTTNRLDWGREVFVIDPKEESVDLDLRGIRTRVARSPFPPPDRWVTHG